jgi:hypothetical protein
MIVAALAICAAFVAGRWSRRPQQPNPAAIIAGLGASLLPLLQPESSDEVVCQKEPNL